MIATAARGRPQVHDPDRVRVVVYVRPDQKDELETKAKRQGMSASDVVVAVLGTAGVITP